MKYWKFDHNSIISSLKLDFVDKLEDTDIVLVWNDVNPVERGIINYARSLNKKVYCMQHGRRGSSRYYPPFNEKIYVDKLLVWGDFDKRRLLEAGQDESKIVVVGSPVFSYIQEKKDHEGINVVFCPEHWDRPVEENIQVRDELRKLEGVNIITKIIESHNPDDFDNPIQTNRDTKEHLEKCIEVLQTADIVVGVSESTFELLAQAMNIPVVIMSDWEPKAFGGDMRYTEYPRIISKASKKASLKNLLETIKQQLKHPNELLEQRMNEIVDNGFVLSTEYEISRLS